MWDEFSLVCGDPPYTLLFGKVEEGNTSEKQKWLKEFVGISHTEEFIPLEGYEGYGSFVNHNSNGPAAKFRSFDIGQCGTYIYDDEATRTYGYACHANCYRLLQRELNYSLRFQDVMPLLRDSKLFAFNTFVWSDHGGMSQYHGKSFYESQIVEDQNLWMLEDPIANDANAQRILELWWPLVQGGFQPPEACVNVSLQNSRLAPDKVPDAVAAIQMGDEDAWSWSLRMEGEPCKEGDRSRVIRPCAAGATSGDVKRYIEGKPVWFKFVKD